MSRLSPPVGLVCLAVLLAAVFVFALPGQTVWQRVMMDAGHGPVFAAMAVVLLWLQAPAGRGSTYTLRQHGIVLALAVTLGVLTECAQAFLPDRNVSLGDVLHDAMGAVLGLGSFALVERSRAHHDRPPGRAHWLWALVLGSLLALVWTPLECARAYAQRAANFPTLAPIGEPADAVFANARDARITHAPVPAPWHRADDTSAALRLDFAAGARPAFELAEIAPDWRGYEVFALDLTNPGEEAASFVLRILDSHHDWSHEDRLNLPVVVPPRTRTTVRVSLDVVEHAPARRPMDLAAIANVMLFATAPSANRSYYVSRVWLE
jgi:hypothetical protein